MLSVFYLLLSDAVGAGVPAGASGITIIVAGIVPVVTAGIVAGVAISAGSGAGIIRALGGIARIGEALLGELLSLLLLLGFLFGRLLLCVLLSLLLRVFGGLLVGVVDRPLLCPCPSSAPSEPPILPLSLAVGNCSASVPCKA